MKFEIVEDTLGYTLLVDDEPVLECMSKENIMELSFNEVLHLIEEVNK